MKLLEDKVVIITGAGRPKGMGRAAAIRFAEHGAHVVVTDLVREDHAEEDQAAIEKVAGLVRDKDRKAMAIGVDVSNRDQVKACVNKVVEEFGVIDVMVNNAGTAIGAGPFLEQTDAQWDISYNVHMKGTLYFCQEVIPHMQKQGGGAIVNNASMLGVAAESHTAAYTATKFGVVGLTKTIAAEFGRDNIRCNAVCPGSVATQMQEEAVKKFAAWFDISIEEAWKDAERCALGRSAQPEEVADVMVYFASPMSGYVSGQTLLVCGAANPGL